MEMILLIGLDYLSDKMVSYSCHQMCMEYESNLIDASEIKTCINFQRAIAQAGLGRSSAADAQTRLTRTGTAAQNGRRVPAGEFTDQNREFHPLR